MKILFLDIDGVLNGIDSKGRTVDHNGKIRATGWGIDPVCVERLNGLLDRVPDLHVVMSSSWRHWFERARQNLIAAGFRHDSMLVGKTREDDQGWQPIGLRGEQIAEWLRENAPTAPYVVLDDDAIEGHGDRWVQTWFADPQDASGGTGLTDWHVERVVALLEIA